ncbi:MAG: hypothetical protein CMB56_005240 [Methanobacteriota archaeon]|nr:MAG: hypothetical protein CMB56_005240 [Euryarchaeota archaeon]
MFCEMEIIIRGIILLDLSSRKEFKIALISTILFFIFYFILGYFIWKDIIYEEIDGFCEGKRQGLLKEPINSISNIAYVIVGLYILYIYEDFPKEGKNPMISKDIAPILYAAGSIYIGLGSFAMHGSNTPIGGILDWSGMLFFISFPVFYNLSRGYTWFEKRLLISFSIVFIFTAIIDAIGSLSDLVLIQDYSGTDTLIATTTDSKNLKLKHITRDYFWALYIGTWIILESKNITKNNLIIMIFLPLIALFTLTVDAPHMLLLILTVLFILISYVLCHFPGKAIIRNHSPYLWLGILTYVLGNIVWRIDKTVEYCKPESLFQYHALWHILTAGSVFFFYKYFTTERNNLELD